MTVGPDGAPQVSCVWVRIEDDEIVFASVGPRRKLHDIARDPRVALSIETDEVGQLGRADGYRSSTATHSMWGVCGKRSTGRTRRSA